MKKEQQNFYMGLLAGIAVISFVGFAIMTVAYFTKGQAPLAGTTAKQVEDNKQPQEPTQPTQPTQPTPTVKGSDIEITSTDHVRGNPNADITIVEFSDYQCPFCQRFHNTMKQAMDTYGNDIRWVYKHFPLDSLHPYARQAAQAAECAGDQDKFWEYTDELYDNQSSIKPAYFAELAKELNLNTSDFESCLSSEKYASKVNSDFNLGRQAGITGTPGGFVNDQQLRGAIPIDQLSSMIESLK
jgi:protein-disulfide isomerase